MKKLFVLIIACIIISNSYSQNLGALLAPIPGTEVVEYMQVKYQTEPSGEKIQNININNGTFSEKLNREFKSAIELYNFLGRAGWSFISESTKDEKGQIFTTVSFSRKIQTNNNRMTMGGPNMPQQRPNIDSLRRAQQMQQNQMPPRPQPAPAQAPEKPKAKEKK